MEFEKRKLYRVDENENENDNKHSEPPTPTSTPPTTPLTSSPSSSPTLLIVNPVLKILNNDKLSSTSTSSSLKFYLNFGKNTIGLSKNNSICLSKIVSHIDCSRYHFTIDFDGNNFFIINNSKKREILLKLIKNDEMKTAASSTPTYTDLMIKEETKTTITILLKPNEKYQIFNQTRIIIGSTILSLFYIHAFINNNNILHDLKNGIININLFNS